MRVNYYAPSIATWNGVTIETSTDFPEGESVTLKLGLNHPRTFTLALRKPSWANEKSSITLNGQPAPGEAPHGYLELTREWKNGDTVALNLPKSLHIEVGDDAIDALR